MLSLSLELVDIASVVDPDLHGSGTFAWIRIWIQLKMKEQISKNVISL